MKLNIARNLKKYRKERDITQEALAKELGISAQSVSKWERGEGYPDIELLPNLANHLNITVDELLGNDSAARQEDISQFRQKFWSSDTRREGILPDAWLPCEANFDFCLAAAYFGMGEKEKGYELLECSVKSHETWLRIPQEAILEFGCRDLFGGIFTQKKNTGGTVFLPDEAKTPADDVSYFVLRSTASQSLLILRTAADPDWSWNCGISKEWLSDVAKEVRFLGLVERAKDLCSEFSVS
ncbi:MAG: helix-turn-helix transcriptional regulator [Eubacteriales bacterium]